MLDLALGFVIEKKKLVRYTGLEVRVEVPNGITAIGEEAFARTPVREVVLPDTVTRIGREAFTHTKLERVQLPPNLKSIGNAAFAFSGLRRIEIPDGVGKIPWQAFNGCVELEDVILPRTLTRIENSAFRECRSLQKINLDDISAEIADGAFDMCDSLADEEGFVVIGGTLHKSIAIYRAENISIPPTVRRVGDFSFHTMDDVKHGKRFCTSVVVPDTVVELGYSAFSSCTVLEEITLPDHISRIPGGCFYGCSRLKKVHMGENTTFELSTFEGSGFTVEAKKILARHG